MRERFRLSIRLFFVRSCVGLGGSPILLWARADAGHQLNSSEVLSAKADVFAFLFGQLEMGFKEMKSPLAACEDITSSGLANHRRQTANRA